MAGKNEPGAAAPFDELLERARQRFDALDRGPERPARAPPPAMSPVRSDPQSEPDPAVPLETPAAASPAAVAPNSFDAAGTSAGRTLTSRYGDGWRFDLTDQHVEGDEIVVRGRLSVGDAGTEIARDGRARLTRPGATLAGAVGDIPFTLGAGSNGVAGADGTPSEKAFAEAATEALAACVAELDPV